MEGDDDKRANVPVKTIYAIWLRGRGWLATERGPLVFVNGEAARALCDRFYARAGFVLPIDDLVQPDDAQALRDLQPILLEQEARKHGIFG